MIGTFFFFTLFLQQEDDEMLVPHPEFTEGPQPMEGESSFPLEENDAVDRSAFLDFPSVIVLFFLERCVFI